MTVIPLTMGREIKRPTKAHDKIVDNATILPLNRYIDTMIKRITHIDSPAVGCMLGKAYQTLLSQLASALKEAGLEITTTEYLVLRALYSSDGIQQCELATITGKDKASICRCVSALEKNNLVRTESVSHKCLNVYLSEKARLIEPQIMAVARQRHRALIDMTTDAQLKVFTDVLKSIITTS